jgi:hypothetical protein
VRNAVLARLDALVGDWRGEAILDGKVVGRNTVHSEWLDSGFLLQRSDLAETTPDIPPEWVANAPFPVTLVIGLDDSGEQFTVLYSDARDVHRVYQMTFAESVWTMTRLAEGFNQRYEGRFTADGNRIDGYWDFSADGTNWRRDFDIVYTRA